MDEHAIQLVKDSFDLVEPIAPQAAASFYTHLFGADPSLQSLFKGDMVVQGHKLMQMIALAVSKLHEPEVLVPALQKLGQRHMDCVLRDAHFELVQTALLKTLRQVLGVAFTPDVEAAWIEACGLMADTMREAANRPSLVSGWATL
jgi:hemoglobin-like flavoprotein